MVLDKAITSIAAVLFVATTAAAQTSYPIVISSESKFDQLGISPISLLPTRCYHHGDGGPHISLSNALLAFYQSQGFSRRSACMALISGIRFNPETGQRLATYIWAEPRLFKNGQPDPRYWTNGYPDGDMSDELPISLPRCFARGLPFSDCVWRYDVLTGKRMSAADTAKHAEVGRMLESFLSRLARLGLPPSQPLGYRDGFLGVELWTKNEGQDPPWSDIDFDYTGGEMHLLKFYDFSSEFPKGYGYALLYTNNDGGLGPDVSPETVKAAIEGQRRPQQINLDRLKDIWSAGSN
jgi:hypothetical protein